MRGELYHIVDILGTGQILETSTVQNMQLWTVQQGVLLQFFSVQIFPVQSNAGNLTIEVGGVIINTLCCVAAGSVEGLFKLPLFHLAAPVGLRNNLHHMEELIYRFPLPFRASGIELRKGRPHKSALGRQIPRKAQRPHPTAVSIQVQLGRKGIFWIFRR